MEKQEKDKLLTNAMDAYGHYLSRLAYALVKDREKAKDIVQDVFIRYYLQLDQFEGRSSVKTYLYRNKTEFFVYNLTSRKQVGKYSVPYKAAENVTLINNKIYAAFSNDDKRPTILGYIDLSNGEFHEIHTPPFTTYAVYKNYIALSVVEKNTDTVKLYQLENENLKELPIFNNIKERLVMPRFTDDGSLIVNGEAADFSMYLQDVE